jgi:hypothetical protein
MREPAAHPSLFAGAPDCPSLALQPEEIGYCVMGTCNAGGIIDLFELVAALLPGADR